MYCLNVKLHVYRIGWYEHLKKKELKGSTKNICVKAKRKKWNMKKYTTRNICGKPKRQKKRNVKNIQ